MFVSNGMELREGAPQILSVSFLGVRSEVLLHTLEEKKYLRFSRKRLLQPQKEKAAGTLKCKWEMEAAQREKHAEIQFFRGEYI